jgi:type II secretory pathway pseudopilin PulG
MLMRARHAPGFTLAELLAAAVLLGAIGAAVLSVTLSQMRFHAAAAHGMEARRTVRTGLEILRTDLRALAPASRGIYALDANGLEFRALLGSSIICHIDAARTTVGIPPTGATLGVFTSWAVPPQRGDTVLVHLGSGSIPPDDRGSAPVPDEWRSYVLAADPSGGGICPTTSGFTRSPAEAAAALALRLATPLEPEVSPGMALRFVRRARYQLYKGSDGGWHIGYFDCLSARSSPCATIQPVIGPFAPNGVRFVYRDANGAGTADPARVARIDVLARAPGRGALPAGTAGASPAESLLITIAPRNR